MKKKVARGAFLLLTLCLSLSTVGCKKSNESNKIKEGQSISSEEKGTSTNKKDKNTDPEHILCKADLLVSE